MRCPSLIELPPPPKGKSGWPWTVETPPASRPGQHNSIKISIVTPSLNQGQYIEETIRSVVLQGYPNLEYIIIDGGSSDQSVEIIKKYSSHLAFWTIEKDHGQSDATNKGLKRATGEIYGWINSDDCLARDTLWEVAKAYRACKDKQRFWVVFAIECIDERAGKRNLIMPSLLNDADTEHLAPGSGKAEQPWLHPSNQRS
jgi:glycosyltransferase involved in cell wall biosynthesis